jgi:Domain of unknown function (DUF5666)
MSDMVARLLLLLTFLVAPTIASAAVTSAVEISQHVLGTITAIDEKHVEVKTLKGKTVSVKLTKQVRFKDKNNPKSTARPTVGDRVVIEATKEDKVLIAKEIHYSAVKSPPAMSPATLPSPSTAPSPSTDPSSTTTP